LDSSEENTIHPNENILFLKRQELVSRLNASNVSDIENNEQLWKCFSLKEAKETQQLNVVLALDLLLC
jgi:hypothetical protein